MTLESYALAQVQPGHVLGLGSGRAAERFVRALGARVGDGLAIRAVATSEATAKLARELSIPLVALDEVEGGIDLAVDGADEVDPHGALIKGYGGALLREKVVASSAARAVILVGAEKCVPRLGTRGRLPVEVLPFAWASVRRRLESLGFPGTPRLRDGRMATSDNGNALVDCKVGPLVDPAGLDRALHAIPGLLETGLFLDLRATIVVEREHDLEIRVPGDDA